MVTIEDLISIVDGTRNLFAVLAAANLPTRAGLFQIHLYEDVPTGEERRHGPRRGGRP